jgi:hypothetical protein
VTFYNQPSSGGLGINWEARGIWFLVNLVAFAIGVVFPVMVIRLPPK